MRATRHLIPQPRRLEDLTGTVRLSGELTYRIRGLDRQAEKDFHRFISRCLRPWNPQSTPRGAVLSLKVVPANALEGVPRLPASLAGEAYTVSARRTIRIEAAGAAGLRHAVQTLRQLIEDGGDSGCLPACRIADWPRAAFRCLYYDLASERSFRAAHLRRVIEKAAYFKFNQLHLGLGNLLILPGDSGFGVPGGMTVAQARALCRYAALHGVTVVPQVPTLGHMDSFLHGPAARFREDPASSRNLCPTHPDVAAWLSELLAGVAHAFHPPYMHVGYDESRTGTCRRCRRHGTPEQLLTDHLQRIDREVRRLGARTMIYGDKFLSPAEFPLHNASNGGTPDEARRALDAVSRDIIITHWHYTTPYSGTTAHFVRNGFTVLGVTANNGYWHDAVPLRRGQEWITELIENDFKEGAIGGIHCSWEHYRGHVIDQTWALIALAAERYWTDREHDRTSWSERFSRRFYGTGDDYGEMMSLAEVTPTRRRTAFLDCHPLVLPEGFRLPWQIPFDYVETGERILATASRLKKTARRQRDTLPLLDMPGEIIRYLGRRARARLALEQALAEGRKRVAVDTLCGLVDAVVHIRRRLDQAHRLYGCAVVDRQRCDRQLACLEHGLALVRRRPAARLADLAVDTLIADSTAACSNDADAALINRQPNP